MSAQAVTAALQGWEDRLRSLGAAAVDGLRPGLTREQVDAMAVEFEGGLPEEAAAIWMWHDGEDLGDAPMPGLRGLIPHRFFQPLREAFAQARQMYEMTSAPFGVIDTLRNGPENATVRLVYPEQSEEPPGQALWYRPWWLMLLTGGGSTFVDCAQPKQPEAPIGLWDPHAQHLGVLTLTERVWWWHWALDHGHWWIDDHGLWGYDPARCPEVAFGDIAYRHVLP